LPFLYNKRTVLFTVCAYWLVPAVVVSSVLLYIAAVCLFLPFWENVSSGSELRVVIVRLLAGRGIVRGWVVGLTLWLLEF